MGSSESPFGDQYALPNHSTHIPISITRYDQSNIMSEDTMKEVQVQVPTHPIPSMQGAFAESMLESATNPTPNEPKKKPESAAVRRQNLIDQEISEETSRWRQKPGQRYHELWKLMAQISFGMYLLLNGIAKDDEQVMNILQGHVDEVDEFLEITLEDFNLAQEDIDDRLKLMKLPLENIHTFDAMLEDRQFRLEIVSGNEQIEHVITRTASGVNAALKDVQQGIDACKEFTFYLEEELEDPVWRDEHPEMEKVYEAMKGNVEGWYKAYVLLQTKGNHLSVALVQLGSIIAEMDRRAGEISRKTRFSISPKSSLTSPPQSPPPRQSREVRRSMLKNLPQDPNMITPAIRAALPAFSMVQDRERSPELESRASSPEPEHFILAPRTYTPVPPSPQIEQSVQEPEPPAPEISKRSSLRKRFSLGKRKDSPPQSLKPPENPDSYWGPRERVYSISETQARRQQSISAVETSHRPTIAVPSPHSHDLVINTPPSRGLDSAYCSDLEKPLTPYGAQFPIPKLKTDSPSLIQNMTFPLPSPRSDQTPQYFRRVNASPNSPLQRPWTAGPSHMHTSSSSSSISRSKLQFEHRHTPSQLGLREQAMREQTMRGSSRMGMSMRSEMTNVTVDVDEKGRKVHVKKKRSAFGWLKKAFALDEEERKAFEEKRRGNTEGYGYGNDRSREDMPRWVDGKRVDVKRPDGKRPDVRRAR